MTIYYMYILYNGPYNIENYFGKGLVWLTFNFWGENFISAKRPLLSTKHVLKVQLCRFPVFCFYQWEKNIYIFYSELNIYDFGNILRVRVYNFIFCYFLKSTDFKCKTFKMSSFVILQIFYTYLASWQCIKSFRFCRCPLNQLVLPVLLCFIPYKY